MGRGRKIKNGEGENNEREKREETGCNGNFVSSLGTADNLFLNNSQ